MNRTTALLILLAGIMLLPSCQSMRSAMKAPIKEEGPEYLYSKLRENEFSFDWFSARIDASYYEKRSSSDFKGQIRIRKDSLIWLSVSPALGIELFRLELTTDSVKYVNRVAKEYFAGDYALVSRFMQINIDFDILQALILGNDFQNFENGSFRAAVDSRNYRLTTTGRRKVRKEFEAAGSSSVLLLQNIWLDPQSFKIIKLDVKEYMKENRKLEAQYSGFIRQDNQYFPTTLRFYITAEQNANIKLTYNRPSLNEPMTFPFTIPDNYKRIY
ncbi:MAG: DUF4292 domain-containing protein [Bacteroidales bacterium]|nr:DUF4292 domain-containing protein [Bacteroidales bacterium]